MIFITLPTADHGNKSLFNLAISKELSERLIGVQNAPATKCVTMVMCIRPCIDPMKFLICIHYGVFCLKVRGYCNWVFQFYLSRVLFCAL